jgi:hypothetical protein
MYFAAVILTLTNLSVRTMYINNLSIFYFFKKGMHIFNEALAEHEKLCVNAENEYQAMSCGAFNPRFLAKIKRSKALYK